MYVIKSIPKTSSFSVYWLGALAFDKKTGFWMISSIPRFPAKQFRGYFFSDKQTRFGQMVLCVTVPLSAKKRIENIFGTINPYIYDQNNFTVKKNEEITSITKLSTSGATRLTVFAKSAMFGKDIYSGFIRQTLKDELNVQTWHPNIRHYRGKVLNVRFVDFGDNLSFETNLDHSKWAVATKKPYTCIGDLNRRETQFNRGGLSVCLKDTAVARQFRKLYALEMTPNNIPKNTCLEEKIPRIKKIKKTKKPIKKNLG